MRHLAVIASLALSTLALGCSSQSTAEPAEVIGKAASPIFNGQADTTHKAVVYVELGGGSCTGTIIASCEGTGYVLTAAHCCETPVVQAVMGNDAYDFDAQVFDASDTYADPVYSGPSDHDFCLFKISGTDPSTPVIPAMRPEEDALQTGDTVEFVGYGVTEYDDNNSQRRHVSDDISGLTKHVMSYDQQPGGPCNGDSGGPALSLVGGALRVSGVTSQGDDACVEYGESGRVSGVYESFIAPYLGACAPSSGTTSSSSSTGAGGDPSGTGGGMGGSAGAGGQSAVGGAGGQDTSAGVGAGTGDTGGSDDTGSGGGGASGDGNNSMQGACAFQTTAEGDAAPFGLALGLSCVALRRRRRS
jgi:hypothetical protein